MKKQLLVIGMLTSCISFAQTDQLWSSTFAKSNSEIIENKTSLLSPKIYALDFNGLKNALAKAPKRLSVGEKSEIIISFPNSEGKMENFKVRERLILTDNSVLIDTDIIMKRYN